MRWLVAIFGVPVVLGLIAISVTMNVRFGLLLGRSDTDALVYAAASACADILKCLIPLVLAWSWEHRRHLVTFAAGLLFVIFTAYSVASSLGYAAINRADLSGQRAGEIARHRDLRAELDRKQAERARLSAFRPAATVEAEMLAVQQHTRWTATDGCARATLSESRAFCDAYFQLKAEHATAEAASRLDAESAALRQKLAVIGDAAHSGSTDPQLEVIAQIFSLRQDATRLALTILLSALVELGSGFGFTVVLAMWREPGHQSDNPTPPAPPIRVVRSAPLLPAPSPVTSLRDARDISSVAAWAETRLMAAPRRKLHAATLYADYVKWLKDRELTHPVTWAVFAQWMHDAGHEEQVSAAGRVSYLGIALKEMSPNA
jgi:hypothetical protein